MPLTLETTTNNETKISPQNNQEIEIESNKNYAESNVEVKKISSGLMLAQYYNSDSNDDDEDENDEGNNQVNNELKVIDSLAVHRDENPIPPGVLVPPSELRMIIDKTAIYVLKNGKEFEDILRAKNDQRFTFLQYKDRYYVGNFSTYFFTIC